MYIYIPIYLCINGSRSDNRALTKSEKPWRVLVATGGIPGTGKSTFAARLQAALNAQALNLFCDCLVGTATQRARETSSHAGNKVDKASEPVGVVGLDGCHYFRAELDKYVSRALALDSPTPADPVAACWGHRQQR